MTNSRVNFLGASGVGTSTVGRLLADALRITHFEADDYYHGPSDPPFQNLRSPEERCELLTRDLGKCDGWVLSGGIVGWEPLPVIDLTFVVFLWVPTHIRIERLRRRERERFGTRIDLGGDMHETHEEFIDWASKYDTGNIEGKTLDLHEEHLQSLNCPVLRLRGDLPANENLSSILSFQRNLG